MDLVTGGSGFIGSHLVEALLDKGRSVRVLDNFSVGRIENLESRKDDPKLEIVQGSVEDRSSVTAGVERIFHLAARADIVPSIQMPDEYFHSNVVGTFNVLEAARKHGIRRLVYAASSSCYGIPETYPTAEDSPADPQYPYALTKYLGEQQVLHWAKVYDLPAVSLRLFNVYGPRARTSGTYGAVFGVFLAQLLAGEPLTVVGDGTQTRDFTFVADVVEAFVMAGESDLVGEVMNVGTSAPQSVNHLVELLNPDEIVHLPKRPGEPDCTWADTARITERLGWEPKVSFEDGVQVMLENIEYWREAPIWTPESIKEATVDWFRFLGEERDSD